MVLANWPKRRHEKKILIRNFDHGMLTTFNNYARCIVVIIIIIIVIMHLYNSFSRSTVDMPEMLLVSKPDIYLRRQLINFYCVTVGILISQNQPYLFSRLDALNVNVLRRYCRCRSLRI